MTTAFWAPMLDSVVSGAHVVAAIAGAFVGLHGAWRIVKNRGHRG